MNTDYFLTQFESKKSGRVTHLVISKNSVAGVKSVPLQKIPRTDLISAEEPLQAAILCLDNLATFIPHIHLSRKLSSGVTRTVEIWVILKGSVEVSLYDIETNLIRKIDLNANDFVVTLEGGHNYVSQQDETLVLEVKSGPYDHENDKVRF